MPFNSEDPPLPPEGKLDNLLTDPAWQYYNKRVAEMGLASREAIDDNCIRFCPANQLAKHGITSKFTQNRPAILFQYLDMNGRPTENMYQARMIGDPPSFVAPPPGLEMEEYKSRLRKAFPKYLGGRYFDAYFPRLPSAIFTGAVATWVDQKVVFITEGIPKAIRMTQAGLPCISIQGKDMFKYKNGELVEGLQKFLLKSNVEKIIYIADSDARHNQEIRDSAIYLVGLLSANRPHEFASWVMLPETEGFEKTGVDDLLNSKGVQYFLKEFKGWMQEWMGGAWFATFHEISKLLLFVAGSTNFVYLPMRRVISSSSASHIVQPILSTQRGLVNPYSGSKVRPVNLTSTFLSEPSRRTVDGVNFWPGMPEILFKDHENENEDNGVFNLWMDHAPEIIEGDVSPFLNLIEHTIPELAQREVLLKLVAQRIQQPELKSPLIVFLFGAEGTGKTCIATALFGSITTNPDYIHIGHLDLNYAHEEAHLAKQCVCMEEPPRAGMTKPEMEAMFKRLGDSEDLIVNPKGIAQYKVKNRALYWINSNEHFLPVSGDARRWLILRSNYEGNIVLTKACWDWMQTTKDWRSHLRHYLLERYPNIDRHALTEEAKRLDSKYEILQSNKPAPVEEFEEWVDDLPEEMRELGFVPTKLLFQMAPFRDKTMSERQTMGNVLRDVYPLAKVGNSQDGKVRVGDSTTAFRSLVKKRQVKSTSTDLKPIYDRWVQWITTKKY